MQPLSLFTYHDLLVDGTWNQWTEWSLCSTTCGGGVRERFRSCTRPDHGGQTCPGDSKETDQCNTEFCICMCDN